VKKFFFDNFALIALALVAGSALAGLALKRSIGSALLWGLLAAAGVAAFLILLGWAGAALERLDDLRAKAARRGASLPAELARAWAKGLVSWNPPHAVRSLFLTVWAAVGAGAAALLPKILALSPAGQAAAALALLVAAGLINASFDGEGR